MHESHVVLEALNSHLRVAFPNEAGDANVIGDRLEMLSGNLSVSVEIDNTPDCHPLIAHCHLLAKLGTDDSKHLDACVLGIHENRQDALADAAKTWSDSVAPAILSVARATAVTNAEHFDGSEPNAVIGRHGFMGPLSYRMIPNGFNVDPMGDCELFEFASAMAPPGNIHLAKVTLQATKEGVWNRTVEVDGHEATFQDHGHATWPKSPEHGVVTRFAVFHDGNQTQAQISRRKRLDDAIKAFIVAVGRCGNVDEPYTELCGMGFDEELIGQITNFVPSAATQVVFAGLVHSFATTFVRVTKNGDCLPDQRLMREPTFARSMMLLPKWMQQPELLEACKKAALVSAEFNAINAALNNGSDPKNIRCSPVIVPDHGASDEAVQRALNKMMRRLRAEHQNEHRKKPWWRIW